MSEGVIVVIQVLTFLVIVGTGWIVIWLLQRAMRPWNYQAPPKRSKSTPAEDDDVSEAFTGFRPIAQGALLEADFTGWRSGGRTGLRDAAGNALGVIAPDAGAPLPTGGLEPLPRPHEDVQLTRAPGGLIVATYEPTGTTYVLGFSAGDTAAAQQVLRSLRPIEPDAETGAFSDELRAALKTEGLRQMKAMLNAATADDAPRPELRLVGDGQLADTLERAKGDVAFQTLAPGLHVLYVARVDGERIRLFTNEEVERTGRERFTANMLELMAPEELELQTLKSGLLTNRDGGPFDITVVLHRAFFELLAPKLGAAVLVGIPSFTRLLLASDTADHRAALSELLQQSHLVESQPLSTRLYRVDASGWSVVDLRN